MDKIDQGRVPATAFVVGLNEAEKLRLSLPALNFCSEIIYLDLGSWDNSCQVAELAGATRVLTVDREKNVEAVLAKYSTLCSQEWILLCDPDEIFTDGAQNAIRHFFEQEPCFLGTIGVASLPWTFYFKSRALKGTPWGGAKSKAVLFKKSRVTFSDVVHQGKTLSAGSVEFSLADFGFENAQIRHLWFTSWPSFLEKHRRYLKLERHALPRSNMFKAAIRLPISFSVRFIESFLLTRGFRDGVVGFLLSLVWAWYQSFRELPPLTKAKRA